MNLEVYTKSGELRKKAPKDYICTRCEDKQSSFSAGKIKLPFATFLCCRKCGGKLESNPAVKEWMDVREKEVINKRFSGGNLK